MLPEVELLPPVERGFVLGLALAGAAPAAATRLAGPGGARCARALEALAGAVPAARAAALDELRREVLAPVPAGLERVHPGWIRRALADEPADIVTAVVAGLPPAVTGVAGELLASRHDPEEQGAGEAGGGSAIAPEVVDELRRVLFGDLAPMPAAGAGGGAARGAALLEEIDREGAALLGQSLGDAPPPLIARAAAGVGEPLAPLVIESAKAPVDAAARARARALAAGVGPDEAGLGVARAIGLRALAARAAAGGDPDAVAVLAQSLPPAIGDVLLAIAGADPAAVVAERES